MTHSVVTLHEALSPAERPLSAPRGRPSGPGFHRQPLQGFRRIVASGNQTHHRGAGWRSRRGNSDHDRPGSRLHDRHHGAGVPTAGPNPLDAWKGNDQPHLHTTEGSPVSPSRKSGIGGSRRSGGFHRMLKSPCSDSRRKRKLASSRADVPAIVRKVWERITAAGQAGTLTKGPAAPMRELRFQTNLHE